ncbi:MAG: hypothetical protein A2057_14135 [Ignavibacteria bacterium GWA2_35_9]|nr:MAG: hypothetical protein A2057_14135 [Ignavibacteria bacterium GWA2_35_9]OGU46686.1 MAG: hypothetical protein A2000_08995 [Ignavibacteria bacterium GWB2_36_8]OGU48782.1 MAG: hypothetical protein A2080_00405 [Ignavibacteria bacterium GWC2_36_12]OGU99615.1 MAG: hypothetical protein A2330_08810 [Ignavibacteria bacterium RIFOXYB2_FULL_36_7]
MIDSSDKSFEENFLSYLYILRNEFWEVNNFINTLKNYKPFVLDIRESTPIQNALNITVVISYSRNFKKSYGFNNTNRINAELTKYFTKEENELHKTIISWRDQEYAHSDAIPNDVQIYNDNKSSYSRRVVRQLLEKGQLETLKIMVNKIRDEIEIQIKSLTKC